MTFDDETFEELSTAPKRTSGEEGTVEERDVDDLVKADKHLANKQIGNVPYGLRVAKIRYPGTP